MAGTTNNGPWQMSHVTCLAFMWYKCACPLSDKKPENHSIKMGSVRQCQSVGKRARLKPVFQDHSYFSIHCTSYKRWYEIEMKYSEREILNSSKRNRQKRGSAREKTQGSDLKTPIPLVNRYAKMTSLGQTGLRFNQLRRIRRKITFVHTWPISHLLTILIWLPTKIASKKPSRPNE